MRSSVDGMTVEQDTTRWRGVHHLALVTTDMDATVRFWHGVLEARLITTLATPAFKHYNPLGTVHGGYAAILLDSCMGCAVHTTLPKGTGYITLEFKVSLVRAITADTGPVRAEGKVLSSGRRAATAEGRLTDASGRLLAHATTTCLVFGLPANG